MSATLDTLKLAKRFRDAGASEQLAETFAEAMREARDADMSQLATKADLAVIRADLTHLVTKLELAELHAEVQTTAAELRGEIARANRALLMWLVPLLIGQAALTATLVKLL